MELIFEPKPYLRMEIQSLKNTNENSERLGRRASKPAAPVSIQGSYGKFISSSIFLKKIYDYSKRKFAPLKNVYFSANKCW